MTRQQKTLDYKKWLPLILALVLALGMLIGFRMSDERNEAHSSFIKKYEGEDSGRIGRIEELLRFIDARYVDDINEDELLDAATTAIFNKLDPHSVYLPPDKIGDINNKMAGYYEGVGVETIIYEDTLRVTSVLDDSPAEEYGIKYGDKIIAVWDSVIAGVNMPVNDQWDLIKSRTDEPIELSIVHADHSFEKIKIFPANIKYPNVEFYTIDEVAYINIRKFSDNTYEGLIMALESFEKDLIIKELIIDLRNNPGGYIVEATKILNQLFVEDKRLLVYTKGSKFRKTEYNTTGRPFYEVEKLAIIINRNSASASEIIAGAVQDWDKAIIVGEQSYGKGLVQEQYDLSNGGAIRLTTARYFTPSGRYIQTPFESDVFIDTMHYTTKVLKRKMDARGGISPDVTVEVSDEELLLLRSINQQVITDAYRFILQNQLEVNASIDLNDKMFSEKFNNYTSEFKSSRLPDHFENIGLYETHLKAEVYRQLGDLKSTRKELYQVDQFIISAIESLAKENIFADVQN